MAYYSALYVHVFLKEQLITKGTFLLDDPVYSGKFSGLSVLLKSFPDLLIGSMALNLQLESRQNVYFLTGSRVFFWCF